MIYRSYYYISNWHSGLVVAWCQCARWYKLKSFKSYHCIEVGMKVVIVLQFFCNLKTISKILSL